MSPKRRSRAEVLEVGDLPTEVQLIVRWLADRARAGDVRGVVAVVELDERAYEAKATHTDDADGRAIRLLRLGDHVCGDPR